MRTLTLAAALHQVVVQVLIEIENIEGRKKDIEKKRGDTGRRRKRRKRGREKKRRITRRKNIRKRRN